LLALATYINSWKRLYQADWLYAILCFETEIIKQSISDLEVDPKWAGRCGNITHFQ
jgi:predicted DNA-binding helix-hairpin-helix protein